jgi:hypothetical protein
MERRFSNMARNNRKKKEVISYNQEDIQAAMVRWQQANGFNARCKAWFEYVDYRDNLSLGTSYERYLGILRPNEMVEFLDS